MHACRSLHASTVILTLSAGTAIHITAYRPHTNNNLKNAVSDRSKPISVQHTVLCLDSALHGWRAEYDPRRNNPPVTITRLFGTRSTLKSLQHMAEMER